MKLIPNWRRWYRMFSVQALIAVGALQSVLAVFTDAQLDAPIPFAEGFTWRALGTASTVAVAVIGAVGRVIDQGHTTEIQE